MAKGATRKKNTYIPKSFESTGKPGDTSSNIYVSMLLSPAWLDLTPKQIQLYLVCKAQRYAEKKKPNEDDLCFTMNRSKWTHMYGLYRKGSNEQGFYRDMEALINHGFIACVECGATTREKSIYRFSDKWRIFGTPEFEILPSEMTSGMLRKLHKTTAD